jgi:hypothetical protein
VIPFMQLHFKHGGQSASFADVQRYFLTQEGNASRLES